MATENRSIVITIKNDNMGSANSQDLDVSSKTSVENTASNYDNNSMAKSAFASMAINAGQIVLNELISWADYSVDKYMNLHDDYIGQRNMYVAQHYINGAASSVSTIANFTLVGTAAGPVGAVVGAIVGTAVSIGKNVRSNIQGQDQQNIQLKQMDLQLQYTRNRAGWSLNAASIGEDL